MLCDNCMSPGMEFKGMMYRCRTCGYKVSVIRNYDKKR